MLLVFHDEKDLTHTKDLTEAVSALRRFRDCLDRVIGAWTKFEADDVRFFEVNGTADYHDRWANYLHDIRGHVFELESFQTLLSQKLDVFNSMRDGVSNRMANSSYVSTADFRL